MNYKEQFSNARCKYENTFSCLCDICKKFKEECETYIREVLADNNNSVDIDEEYDFYIHYQNEDCCFEEVALKRIYIDGEELIFEVEDGSGAFEVYIDDIETFSIKEICDNMLVAMVD